MVGVLIQYNKRTGDTSVREFRGEQGPRDATLARFEIERNLNDPDVEVVVIGADSLEVVKQSHSRYFMGSKSA